MSNKSISELQAEERWRQASLLYGIRFPGMTDTRYELHAASWHGRQLNAFEDGWDAAVEFFQKAGLLDIKLGDPDREGARKRREDRLAGKIKYKLIEVVDDSIQEG